MIIDAFMSTEIETPVAKYLKIHRKQHYQQMTYKKPEHPFKEKTKLQQIGAGRPSTLLSM